MVKIIIISNFPGLLDGSYTDRFCYISRLLHEKGYEVEMITSDFCHDTKQIRHYSSSLYPFKVTLLHETPYKQNVSLQRLKSHWEWGRNVKAYLSQIENPDIIYCAIPSLTASKAAADYCKRNGVKFVVDLQDLWPEAFAMAISNKLLQKVFLPMKWYADSIYAAADKAIAVSDTYVDRILEVNKKLSSGLSVFLGNDGDAFDKGRAEYKLDRKGDELIVGYIGNMSTSYDMPCVFDALSKVEKRGKVDKAIRFVLIGGGVDEGNFKDYASRVYPNSSFLGRKSYQEMAGLLCGCDIVVNPIVKGSVASIINKVGDYALSGLPVINTQDSPEYRNLIEEYQCGINCECGNSDEVADAIEKLAMDEALRKKMGDNARRFGIEKFDRRHTYKKIVDAIEAINEHKQYY